MRRVTLGIIIAALAAATPATTNATVRVRLLGHHGALRPAISRRTTLVDPSGMKVGGAFQRAIDNEPIPTYRGIWVIDLSERDTHTYCDWAPGSAAVVTACTFNGPAPNLAGSTFSSLPETVLNPLGNDPQGGVRASLIYEMGHVVDNAYLTDAERERLMRLFDNRPPGDTLAAWWHGEDEMASNPSVDPPGEEFAQVYWTCANRLYEETALDVGMPNVSAASGRRVCQMIARMLR